jgi:hypothetical protein
MVVVVFQNRTVTDKIPNKVDDMTKDYWSVLKECVRGCVFGTPHTPNKYINFSMYLKDKLLNVNFYI